MAKKQKQLHPDFVWRATAQGKHGGPITIDSKDSPGIEFDELFLGRWFHLEAMARGVWWMDIAGYHVWVRVSKKGKVKRVTIDGEELSNYGVPREYNPNGS